MANTLVGGIQVVVVLIPDATKNILKKQYWAAAVPREKAVAAVRKAVPMDWRTELSERHLTPQRLARLKLRPGDVREL
jgi:hypothetical protein